MPMVSEITPLMVITKLEQYDYGGATAIAVVMLVFSFILLLLINLLQAWTQRSHQSGNRRTAATNEPLWVRVLLISLALAFFGIFLLMPLAAVFAEAFKKGWSAYASGVVSADAVSAINLVFGVAAAWAIAKFEFRGKQFLITLIDLTFSVSPVVSD